MSMLAAWAVGGAVLYLLPVLLTFLACARPERTSEEAALGTITVVALDLLSIMLLAHIVPLELAVLISRACWLSAGSGLVLRKRARLRSWWRAAQKEQWLAPIGAALIALFLSTRISGACGIWDRYWHIPLVGSMRGQLTPFFNVYEQQPRPLYYHYAGDVVGVIFQTLSFDHLHASTALSRAHDVTLALFAAIVAGIAPAFGARRFALAMTLPTAMLLAGPVTILTAGSARPIAGLATTFLFSLSFRPHVSLAFILITGFCAALLLPLLTCGRISPRTTRVCLLSCTALLVMSDETSLALLGALFAVAWLLTPETIAGTRKTAALVGLLLLVTIGVVVLVFGGTLSPGAPRQNLVRVAARVPGFMQTPVPFADPRAAWVFVREFWGTLLVGVSGLFAVIAVRRRSMIGPFLGYLILSAIGIGCLINLDVNGGGTECHRFATAPMLLAPLFGVLFVTRAELPVRLARSGLLTVLVAAAIGLPASSSLEWIFGLGGEVCNTVSMPTYSEIDCRRDLRARLGERPVIAYADPTIWYEIAGCRPLNAPSPNTGGGNDISMGWPETGWSAVRKLQTWQGGGEVMAYCSTTDPDDVCRAAESRAGGCVDEAPRIRRCRVTPGSGHF
jgi:hypothetical protein